MSQRNGSACVTGAGGFIASWTVKLLLSKGFFVHGTLRNPEDKKYAHLYKLEKASENLKLFKADLLDYESLRLAIAGCSGVFHVASPVPSTTVPNPEMEVIEPAVKGTLNVLRACVEEKVKRVIFVSSAAAVTMNPMWPKDQVMDENCWSDKEYCRTTKNWYYLSKTEAESEAWKFAEKHGLDLVTVCPSLVLGPILQSSANASSMVLLKLFKGYESLEDRLLNIVDVRDVADALLLAYGNREAEGRYICTAYRVSARYLVDKLRSLFPDYSYPKSFIEGKEEGNMSSERLQRLGWRYRPLEETITDSIESYREAGLLD